MVHFYAFPGTFYHRGPELRVYNGANQYILTTILKELHHIDYSQVKDISIVCGKTDMWRGIDGVANIISDTYNLDLFDDGIFLFYGGKTAEVKSLTSQELSWLLEGLSLQ